MSQNVAINFPHKALLQSYMEKKDLKSLFPIDRSHGRLKCSQAKSWFDIQLQISETWQ